MREPIIGIDLGTSNSVVAVAEDGEARVLVDAGGRKIQPTVVSFHPSGSVIVGAEAKQRRIIDPDNTIYSAKRLIGRTYDSREVREAAARVPYTIKQGVNSQPVVLTRAGEFAIPEISAIMLDHLRGLAQAALSTEITRAVVTVPANFTEAQRTATITAGDIAGIEVVQVINEPTAAALACGHRHKLDRRVAVYDFGGGTFDITILDVRGPIYEVLSTAGDPFLGGDDMDERLVETMLRLFFEQEGVDLRGDEQAMQRLRTLAEQVKIELSRRTRARVTIDALARGTDGASLDFSMRVTREDLEAHAGELVDRSFAVCQEALGMAGLAATDIDDVILVGGTTKMPLVRSRVSELFGRAPRTDVHPDEAVALGAAIHGSTIQQTLGDDTRQSRRRHTAPGMVAPPAPPMAARAPVGSRDEGTWERGGTMPWVGFGEETGIPGVGRGGRPDTFDIPTEHHGPEHHELDPASLPDLLRGPPERPTKYERPLVPEEEGTDVITQVRRESARSLLQDDDEVGTNVETQVRRDSAHSFADATPATMDQVGAGVLGADELFALPEASQPHARPHPHPVTGAQPLLDPAAAPELAAASDPGLLDQAEPQPAAGSHTPIILEVAPHSLGVATVAGYCRQLVPRNSRLPMETREVFTTSKDQQATVRIRVCQGESRRLDDNQVLGDLVLDEIEPRPRGESRIEVVFRIDESGLLHVRARDLNTGLEQQAALHIEGAPSPEEVTAASVRLRRLRG